MAAAASYVDVARATATWLRSVAIDVDDGSTWPVIPGETPGEEPSISLGWGSTGPVLFFLEAYRTTGEHEWLADAIAGGRWLLGALEDLPPDQTKFGLHTGLTGCAFVFSSLDDNTDDPRFKDAARTTLRRVLDGAEREGSGLSWHGFTEVLWGTAGVGFSLLDFGKRLFGDEAIAAATGAGEWLLSQAEDVQAGVRWSLGPGVLPNGLPERLVGVRFPNFAHGTAGIAAFLARLSSETGDERFLDGAMAGMEWVESTCRSEDGALAAFHHEPDATDEFTLGWCHGPPGLGWAFREIDLASGTSRRKEILATAETLHLSGIPAQREPGFWDNVARCCGSASVAEYLLDLHTLTGDDRHLDFARVMVDDLVARATTDASGTRWSNVEFRVDPPVLPPQTTWLQGASGIGSTLLRLHRHLQGDPWVLRWPHAPRTWTPNP